MIQFDATTHRFTFRGKAVPSVTQLLKAGGWIDTTFMTEEGRRRGEIVHQATALLDQDRLDWLSLSDEIRAYVETYERAKKELKLHVRRIEHIVHKGKLFAGIEDREAIWEGQLAVVDLKTGQPKLADKLQIAAYGATHAKAPRELVLYVWPDRYKAVELKPAERVEFGQVWDRIVSLFHWRQRRNGK
jgi:CRISPR/Cas system-associated exonuclease Cas4 (RecB family)